MIIKVIIQVIIGMITLESGAARLAASDGLEHSL